MLSMLGRKQDIHAVGVAVGLWAAGRAEERLAEESDDDSDDDDDDDDSAGED